MKKISIDDILKLGGSLSAHTLKDNEETRKMIEDVKRKQQEIKDIAKINWNDPNLRRPMDI